MSAAVVATGSLLLLLATVALLASPGALEGGFVRGKNPVRRGLGEEDLSPAAILARQLQHTAADSPARFTLLTSLGHLLRDQGRYSDAVAHYMQAEALANSGVDRVLVLRRRGQAELARGRLAAAAAALRAALAAGGEEGEGAAETLHALGDASAEEGKLNEAIETYKRAHRIAQRLGEHEEAIALLADIAEVHNRMGRLDDALRWLRRASEELQGHRDAGAPLPPLAVAKVQSYMASAKHAKGDVEQAAELYQRALRVQAEGLRPSHPDLLATRIGLARTQRDLGDSLGALRGLEAIEKTVLAGPNEGPDLSRLLILKADVLRVQQELVLAQATSEEAMRLQDQWLQGAIHPERAVALAGHGCILHDAGRFAEARSRYEEALDLNLRTVGEMHPETAAAYNSLGTLFQDLHEPLESFNKFAKCLEIQRATVGESNPDVANTYNNMATVLFQQGRRAEAAALLQKSIAILDASAMPKGSPERVLYEENLAEVVRSLEEKAPVTVFA